MVAGTRAPLNEDATADDEAGRPSSAKPESDRKLEEAVRRSMIDLEQEQRGPGDAGRSRPSAS
jgi:hypothetical protein